MQITFQQYYLKKILKPFKAMNEKKKTKPNLRFSPLFHFVFLPKLNLHFQKYHMIINNSFKEHSK